MKTGGKLCAAAMLGGLAGGLALSPPDLKGGMKGFAYGLGMRNVKLDGIGRLVATLLSHADYPPCGAQMHEHVQHLTKVPPREFYLTNALAMVEAHKQVSDWYGMDLVLPVTDIYNYEAEALGAKMIYSDIDMPTIDFTEPLINQPADIDKVNTDLTIDSGRMRYLADNIRGLEKFFGLPKLIPFCAPFSLAVGVRSYPKLIRDMRKDPKFAHELFTWITDVAHPKFLEVIKKETGARFGFGADAWSCFPNLTPQMIEEWVVPYNVRLRKNARKMGMLVTGIVGADYCEEDPAKFDRATMEACWRLDARTTVGAWAKEGLPLAAMGRTQEWPLEWMQDYAVRNKFRFYGKRPIVYGFNARFLREGPAEVIVELTKRVIDKLGREGRLVLFFTQIPASTPPEHIHAAISAFRTYGRYPIAGNLDGVKFEVPEFEPFEVWLKKR